MLQILFLIGVGILGALFIVRKQRARFGETAKQLYAPTPKVSVKKARKREAYTRAEVAKHNQLTDLWIILKDRDTGEFRVYDLTPYVEEHPGGPVIARTAGGDASTGFFEMQHPATVFEHVEDFCIGTLVDP